MEQRHLQEKKALAEQVTQLRKTLEGMDKRTKKLKKKEIQEQIEIMEAELKQRHADERMAASAPDEAGAVEGEEETTTGKKKKNRQQARKERKEQELQRQLDEADEEIAKMSDLKTVEVETIKALAEKRSLQLFEVFFLSCD